MAAGAPPADTDVHGQQVMPAIILKKKKIFFKGKYKKTMKSIQNPS